jgi:hypothetical protein
MEERRVNDTPASRPPDAPMRRANETAATPRKDQPLVPTSESTWIDHSSRSEFERRWHEIQSDFIEEPRRAVGEAGSLMADLMDHIGKNLRSRRGELERRSGESDTEALRLEMRRYKSLMHRMLHGDSIAAPQGTRSEPAAQRPMTDRPTAEQPRPQPKAND